MPWIAQHLRLTAFYEPDASREELPKWASLTGSDPENEARSGNLAQADGSYASGRLALGTVATERADLLYGPAIATLQQEADYPPSIGSFDTAIQPFNTVARRFLQSPAKVLRIAFGVSLLSPTSDRDASYAEVVRLIRTVAFDLSGARDFTYQINRPRRSLTVEGLEINRLAKWAAVRISVMTTDVVNGVSTRTPESHGVRLELDINTDANRTDPLSHDHLSSLFDELTGLAPEIRDHGDIP
ncbi:MAG: hypothetical protein V4550_09075 [Gemmatimonadota bacterium]